MAVDNPYADQQAAALQRSAVARQKLSQLAFAREAYNQKMMERAEKETKARAKYVEAEQENDLIENIIRGGGTVLGGVAGGIIGSIVPGAGTLLGASLGASAGGALGSIFAGVHDYATQPDLPAGASPMPTPDYAGQAANQAVQGGQAYLMNQMYGNNRKIAAPVETAPVSSTTPYNAKDQLQLDPSLVQEFAPEDEPLTLRRPKMLGKGGRLPSGSTPATRGMYETPFSW